MISVDIPLTDPFLHIVTWQLKDRNGRAKRDGCCYVTANKHVSLAMDTHSAREEVLEIVFSMPSVPRLYSERGCYIRTMNAIKSLVVILKGLVPRRTDWR
jgi:hypothetical protein